MNRSAGRTERLYTEVASEFGAALERLARGYERDADKRRDLLQEIHLALWRSLARFDSRCSMRTWVYRVAHNVATSHVIRPKSSSPTLVAADDLESLERMPDAVNRIAAEDRLDRQRTLDRLYESIRQLRPMDRQVMLLYLEEVEAAAIAEITGLTAVNVATKIHRIKQLLTRRFHGRSATGE
jgi:RNA polymerase sigma-70 factor (ECF subfamily)